MTSSITPRSRTRSSTSRRTHRDPYRSARWNLARRMAWKSRAPKVTRRAGRSPSRQSTVAPGSRVATVRPSTTSTAGRGPSDLEADAAGRVEHQGSVEEHVGRDRREHDGPQPGRQQRAPGRQVVGGRPGGRGHEQSVGGVGHEGVAVDGGGDADGVPGHGLLDRGLVEGASARSTTVPSGPVHGHRRGSSAPRPRRCRRGSRSRASSRPAGSTSVR